MPDNAVPVRMQSRVEGSERWHGRNAGGEGPVEDDALPRQGVDRRRGRACIAVAAQVIGAQAINGDNHDVGQVRRFRHQQIQPWSLPRATVMPPKRRVIVYSSLLDITMKSNVLGNVWRLVRSFEFPRCGDVGGGSPLT